MGLEPRSLQAAGTLLRWTLNAKHLTRCSEHAAVTNIMAWFALSYEISENWGRSYSLINSIISIGFIMFLLYYLLNCFEIQYLHFIKWESVLVMCLKLCKNLIFYHIFALKSSLRGISLTTTNNILLII